MPAVQTPSVAAQLTAVLREAFEGPQEKWTYFIDNRPDAGLFATLAALSSAQASRPSGPSGNSIAGHVHHLAFSCAASAAWIRGERPSLNWDESWRIRTVTDPEWGALKDQLRKEYTALLAAIEQHALTNDESLGGSIGAVAHVAYHLAAIRYKRSP
ncbi:MAG TPA: DinB family protein [Gemmatimonadales bacterium]